MKRTRIIEGSRVVTLISLLLKIVLVLFLLLDDEKQVWAATKYPTKRATSAPTFSPTAPTPPTSVPSFHPTVKEYVCSLPNGYFCVLRKCTFEEWQSSLLESNSCRLLTNSPTMVSPTQSPIRLGVSEDPVDTTSPTSSPTKEILNRAISCTEEYGPYSPQCCQGIDCYWKPIFVSAFAIAAVALPLSSCCFCLFPAPIPLKQRGVERRSRVNKIRHIWKRRLVEVINLATSITFLWSVWALVWAKFDTVFGDMSKNLESASCGEQNVDENVRATTAGQEYFLYSIIFNLTMLFIVRFMVRFILAECCTIRMKDKEFDQIEGCPWRVFARIQVFIYGPGISAIDPWRGTTYSWNKTPNPRAGDLDLVSSSSDIQPHDGDPYASSGKAVSFYVDDDSPTRVTQSAYDVAVARREVQMLFFLLILEKFPYLLYLLYYAAWDQGQTYNIYGLVDFCVTAVSVAFLLYELLVAWFILQRVRQGHARRNNCCCWRWTREICGRDAFCELEVFAKVTLCSFNSIPGNDDARDQ